MAEVETPRLVRAQGQIILFRVGKEIYAIDIRKVERIADLQPITRVPRAPGFVRGIMNLAGSIITMIDVDKVLGLEDESQIDQVILLEHAGMNLGLVTGQTTDVLSVDEEFLSGDTMLRDENKGEIFVSSVFTEGDRIINLLDVDKLVHYVETSFNVMSYEL
ncbi:MAG: purine-binding chemotaxis protein CheW [Deltaproteobacteria bacterium]|nr:purine-binding chemotaxis protein CheW [Candidatus Zymogenaceae bacterium]